MLNLNFNPFPTLRTDRLTLREMTLTDTKNLFSLRSDTTTMRYISKPLAQSQDEIKELIISFNAGSAANQFINWGITLHEDATLIGTIGIFNIQKEHHRAEVGYMLHPNFWRRGISLEALKGVIEYAFNTAGLHSLEANVHPGNEASSGLLQKQGFVQEGLFRESYYFNGTYEDAVIYSLINKNT